MVRKTPRKQPVAPLGGWQTRSKSPRIQQSVDVIEKRPVSLDVDSVEVNKRRPVWRFSEIDLGAEWSQAQPTSRQMAALIAKLGSFESMTIGELFAPGGELGKRYDPAEMPDPGRSRLVDLSRDDETEIVRLRCGGKPRLYGFLREHVFHVLWWDPEHCVWPSEKKHT